MSEAERQDVIERLRKYATRIRELMNFIGDKPHLTGTLKSLR